MAKSEVKKTIIKVLLCCVGITFALLGGFYYISAINSDEEKTLGSEKAIVSANMSLDEKVEAIMASMSKTEKLGQLVMIGINGTDVTEDSLFMLHQYHIGGIILFDRNMESTSQVANLNKKLQEQCNEKVPLFIAIDEEGGMVARMKDDLIPPPSQRSIANSGNSNEAYKSAYNIAIELKNSTLQFLCCITLIPAHSCQELHDDIGIFGSLGTISQTAKKYFLVYQLI